MEYIGHRREDGKEQTLMAHLEGVARLAAEFAAEFGAQAHGHRTGMLHDVGKYGEKAQRRQRDPAHVAKTDHSSAGMRLAAEMGDTFAAFAVAGHHSGLMDCGSARGSTPSDGTLWGRIKAKTDESWRSHVGGLGVTGEPVFPTWLRSAGSYAQAMYTRMLFSCLVDADFLDTEEFMRDTPAPRGQGEPLDALLDKLNAYVEPWFPPKTPLNEKRCEILTQCQRGAEYAKGLYTLTVPTGGGKTIASLAFALSHAVRHEMKRVIYVVPYTSIIEQNADVFARVLGEGNVLEHHSGVDYEEQDDEVNEALLRKRLATENWDMPVIVTTAVQFFESLHASRTSKCRKLHHLSNAVIVFDEAQMMPLPYLRPCVAAIAELVQHYGATAVLCTATQPALGALFKVYAPGLPIAEIVKDAPQLYAFFRRVRFAMEGKLDETALAQRLDEAEQALCIVNSRKRARAIYEHLAGEGRYHLSTMMTPNDRRVVIAEIRERLRTGLPCRVVSTSLIEAGVDVDFPTVWREAAGLDSVLQAAGRCNREGKRKPEDCIVHIFECEDGAPRMFARQVSAADEVLKAGLEIDSPEAIRLYFERLLKYTGEEELDEKEIMRCSKECRFREVAQRFKLIDQQTKTIYIPTEGNEMLLEALRRGEYGKKTLRKLAQDAVNVYDKDYNGMADVLEHTRDGFAILADAKAYDAKTGLSVQYDLGQAWFG